MTKSNTEAKLAQARTIIEMSGLSKERDKFMKIVNVTLHELDPNRTLVSKTLLQLCEFAYAMGVNDFFTKQVDESSEFFKAVREQAAKGNG